MTERKRLPWYNQSGDMIQYQNEDVTPVGDWIDPFLTILRDTDGKIIGAELCDVRHWIDGYKRTLTVEEELKVHAQLEKIFGKMKVEEHILLDLATAVIKGLDRGGDCWCSDTARSLVDREHTKVCELAYKFIDEVSFEL